MYGRNKTSLQWTVWTRTRLALLKLISYLSRFKCRRHHVAKQIFSKHCPRYKKDVYGRGQLSHRIIVTLIYLYCIFTLGQGRIDKLSRFAPLEIPGTNLLFPLKAKWLTSFPPKIWGLKQSIWNCLISTNLHHANIWKFYMAACPG